MCTYSLQYLMPFVEQEEYQISSTCRLHPDHDIFRDQEQNKIHVDVNEWRCGYCKKIFRAENFLDQHFDSRHYNLLNVVRGPGFLVFVDHIYYRLYSSCSFSPFYSCKEALLLHWFAVIMTWCSRPLMQILISVVCCLLFFISFSNFKPLIACET